MRSSPRLALLFCGTTSRTLFARFKPLRAYSPSMAMTSGDGQMLSESSRLPDFGREKCAQDNNNEPAVFKPQRVLILTKLTRLEFEKRTNPDLSDAQLEQALKRRGSDYFHLLERHNQHKTYLKTIATELEKEGIEHKIVQRWDYTEENVAWADAIFTAGGDGTFLLAASRIRDRSKPVIGINTDPVGSEGYMCLIKKLPESHFKHSLKRLLDGDFSWMWRQRIRITLRGKNAFSDPIELHDQQLLYPEHRWSEHLKEEQETKLRSGSLLSATHPKETLTPKAASISHPDRHTISRSVSESIESVTKFENFASSNDSEPAPSASDSQTLPVLALNEVFIGESLSSRVSYYELGINKGNTIKQKSSGFTVCTGTGSTSWYFNINKLTDQCVGELVNIIGSEMKVDLPKTDPAMVSRICKRFNDQLLFSPDHPRMAYTVRDPVYNATFPPVAPRGFADSITVKSRCFDAHLVVDGGLSYIFNDGSEATLAINPEDALRTVVFR